jgi:hypothetical protein
MPIVWPSEWMMIDLGEGVALDGTTPDNCKFWISRSLVWLAGPGWTPIPDEFGFVIEGADECDRWVSFRIASAEWLTWLRSNYLRGKDPRSVALLQARQVRLKEAMEKYIPHLVGVEVELDPNYEPPPMDGVTIARL